MKDIKTFVREFLADVGLVGGAVCVVMFIPFLLIALLGLPFVLIGEFNEWSKSWFLESDKEL